MDNIIVWNVRGLNLRNKQSLVKRLIEQHKAGLVGLLETRVKQNKVGAVYLNLFRGWCFTCNNAWHKGGRIMVAWDPLIYDIDILFCSSQIIHMRGRLIGLNVSFNISVVYAFNREEERKDLWNTLTKLEENIPWVILGDFNAILHKEDRIGPRAHCIPSESFLQWVRTCKLDDVRFTGCRYTWTNKQVGEARIW